MHYLHQKVVERYLKKTAMKKNALQLDWWRILIQASKRYAKIKKAIKQYETSSTHKVLKELPVAAQAFWQRS